MKTRTILFLAASTCLIQLFMNCSALNLSNGFTPLSSTDSAAIPTTEVSAEANAPTNNSYMVPRSYVIGLLTDIFTSSNYPVNTLTSTLRSFVLNKPGSFGGNCDLNSSETGNDCGGDISNSALAPLAAASTLRAVSISAACENILSDDNAVQAVLEKIPHGDTPTSASVGQLYSLFRRGWDPDPSYVQTLMQMDQNVTQEGTNNLDRWRLQILMICEDPVWQSL